MVGTIVIIGTGIITSVSVYLLIISAKKLQDRQRTSYLDYGQVRPRSDQVRRKLVAPTGAAPPSS